MTDIRIQQKKKRRNTACRNCGINRRLKTALLYTFMYKEIDPLLHVGVNDIDGVSLHPHIHHPLNPIFYSCTSFGCGIVLVFEQCLKNV